jgi:transcriptional regulator with XRE-family HTH domain
MREELEFGARLQSLRMSQGLSLRQLAKKAGCSPSVLLNWENNRASPTLGNLFKISNALNMTVSDVLRQEPDLAQPLLIDPKVEPGPLALRWSHAKLRHVLADYGRHQITALILNLAERGSTPPRKSRRPINKLCMVLQGDVRLKVEGSPPVDVLCHQVVYYNMYFVHQWENISSGEAQILMFHPYSFRLFEQEEEDLNWERRQMKLSRKGKVTRADLPEADGAKSPS